MTERTSTYDFGKSLVSHSYQNTTTKETKYVIMHTQRGVFKTLHVLQWNKKSQQIRVLKIIMY